MTEPVKWMPKSMTQEMVEAGIGSLGDDDARPTALVVADMYAAIRAASPPPTRASAAHRANTYHGPRLPASSPRRGVGMTWKLVPVEATPEMVEAGVLAPGACELDFDETTIFPGAIYRGMLSASPAPGEEVRSVLEAAAQDVLDSNTRPSAKELTTAFLCALGGEE